MRLVVCVCITQWAFGIAAWIAEWITKPARFTGQSAGRTGLPSMSMSSRFEALISR
jgi:hypothetical protein